MVPQREGHDQHHQRGIEDHQTLDDGENGALHVARRARRAHQFRRATEIGVRTGGGDFAAGLALAHDGAGVGRLAGAGVHWQRLAGQGCLIQRHRAVEEREIGRH